MNHPRPEPPAVAPAERPSSDVPPAPPSGEHLFEPDRLIAFSTLAAGVAHEIDDPITSVMRNLDFVSRLLHACGDECRSGEVVRGATIADTLQELSRALQFALDGSRQVRRIVQDLSTFAQSDSEHHALLDVRSVLDSVLHLVSNEIRRRARFVKNFREVPLVDVNQARLARVFVTLLIHAAQAIPEGDAASHEISVTTYTDEEGRAVFEVRDSGAGIAEDVGDHVFDPSFATGPDRLELSICQSTVRALGGQISARSAPGAGSVFRVAIPAAELGLTGLTERDGLPV